MRLEYTPIREDDLEYALECHCRICHVCNNFPAGERPDYERFRCEFVDRGAWEESRIEMIASLRDARTMLECVDDVEGGGRVRAGYLWVVFDDWYEQRKADIDDLYVEESYRRRGVGMELLAYIEGEVRKRGANLLVSGTGAENYASQALHRKYGFGPRRYEYEIWLR